MDLGHLGGLSDLDTIRLSEGAMRCKAVFGEALQKNAGVAAALLNDERLTFPCLYILREQAEGPRVKGLLSPRNGAALQLMKQLKEPSAERAAPMRLDAAFPALKWMLETGTAEDILENAYESALDAAASVLLDAHREADVLELVASLLFRRNKNGRYIHDLVWALFRAHDPRVLRLIAARVLSQDPKEAALACELLNINAPESASEQNANEQRHTGYLSWLKENEAYLYFTDESFQYASGPKFCAVDLERKYLQRSASGHEHQPLSPSDEPSESLQAFKRLKAEEQQALAEHSQRLRAQSPAAWKEWLQVPVDAQIQAARAETEAKTWL